MEILPPVNSGGLIEARQVVCAACMWARPLPPVNSGGLIEAPCG